MPAPFALWAALVVAVPPLAPSDPVVRHSGSGFRAVVEIIAVAAPASAAGSAAPFEAAFDEVRRIEALVDEDDVNSPVARINAAAGGPAVAIDPEVFAVLLELQRIAKLSKGAFDVTAAAYPAAWHSAAQASAAPSKKDIDKARALVGFADLVLDAAARTAQLKIKGARIGVRLVARGYALERAAAMLESKGVSDFVIVAGGDVIVRGKKGPRPWMVGIQDPRAAGHFAALAAAASVVMTTGDYEEFFFDGGVRYHDVVDPRSGQPASHCRSVTIVANDALTAEALSRAVFVLGAREGLALLQRLKGVEAIIVTSDNKVVLSRGLQTVVQHRPPTDGP